jgi:RNA methyltransferase, TrmH family
MLKKNKGHFIIPQKIIVQITSLHHPLIKELRKLHDHKGRDAQRRFIAEGVRTCTTLLTSPLACEYLFITPDMHEAANGLHGSYQLCEVSEPVMKKLSTTTTPSGMLAVFKIPDIPHPDQLTTGLVLTHIADPGNMGTLMRTSAALGYTTLVVVEGVDQWHPKVVQASAGTIGALHIFPWSWDTLVQQCIAQNITLSALVVDTGKDFFSAPHYEHELFIVGSEAHGIPRAWLADCHQLLTLPMPGNTESLNAGVAGSIALYASYLRIRSRTVTPASFSGPQS